MAIYTENAHDAASEGGCLTDSQLSAYCDDLSEAGEARLVRGTLKQVLGVLRPALRLRTRT